MPKTNLAALLGALALSLTLPFQIAHADACVEDDDCFDTIQEAVDEADEGDTIEIEAGRYEEVVTITTEDLTLRGEGWDDVVIDPDLDDDAIDGPGITIAAEGVTVEHLAVHNADSPGILITEDGEDATVRHVEIRNARGDCIMAKADHPTIADSHLESCNSEGIGAGELEWAIEVDGAAIHRNVIKGTGGHGVEVLGDDASVGANTITRTNDACIRVFGDDADIDDNHMTLCTGGAVELPGPRVFGSLVFDPGFAEGSDDARVTDNSARGVGNRCLEIFGDGAELEDNWLRLCEQDAINVRGDDARVAENDIAQGDRDGVEVTGDDSEIEGNEIVHVTHDGIQVTGDGAAVHGNEIVQAIFDGIDIDGDDAKVGHNDLYSIGESSENPDGIDINGADAHVYENVVYGARENGIDVDGPRPTITGNLVQNSFARTDSGFRGGIVARCADDCDGGLVEGNVVREIANANGILIVHDEAGTSEEPFVVRDNESTDNGDDGFEILGSAVDAYDNVALRNGNGQQRPPAGSSFQSFRTDTTIGDHGFFVLGADHVLEGNRADEGAEDGYHVCGDRHELDENVAGWNLEDGFDVGGDGGIFACAGSVCDGGPNDGNDCDVDADCTPGCLATEVLLEQNEAEENVAEGVEVSELATDTDVVENEAEDQGRNDFCDDGTGTDTDDNDFDAEGACVVD